MFKTLIEFLRDREYRNLIFTTLLVLLLGTLAYRILEGWPWLDCIYFCVITLSTVGYGDFAPVTPAGKAFTILYIIIGIGIILTFINTLYHHFSQNRKPFRKSETGESNPKL